MHDPIATSPVASGAPSLGTLIAVAGLVLLSSACAGDGPVSPPAALAALPSAMVSTSQAASATGPAACVPDPKLIGRIALSTADEPGTWWHLTREGMDAAGLKHIGERDFLVAGHGLHLALLLALGGVALAVQPG